MSDLKNKLKYLDKDKKIQNQWQSIDAKEGLSTREKLDKLVNLRLKQKSSREKTSDSMDDSPFASHTVQLEPETSRSGDAVLVREYQYPLETVYGMFSLGAILDINPGLLNITFGEEDCEESEIDPRKLLFFDTETTGLSGGTGTIPFMLGFGYFEETVFRAKIFILNEISREDLFFEEIDRFLAEHDFSATVTYNGKTFDFPLMESRYIMQRKRFPLLRLPHLDFLFPARVVWKNTYESRRLGYLGDVMLGISREDDVDGSQIPALYFNFLRSKAFHVIEKVVEHNALDLLGLAALLLQVLKYVEDIVYTQDEGEILGTARLYEKYGDFEAARTRYTQVTKTGCRSDVTSRAVKALAVLKKKEKLYDEASDLWEMLSQLSDQDQTALRELAIHLEHREKNYVKALDYTQRALDTASLTDNQREDFQKRLKRLTKKINTLDKED